MCVSILPSVLLQAAFASMISLLEVVITSRFAVARGKLSIDTHGLDAAYATRMSSDGMLGALLWRRWKYDDVACDGDRGACPLSSAPRSVIGAVRR